MYQTDWGLSSVIVRASGGPFGAEGLDLQLPMASLEGKGDISGRIWGSFLPIGADGEKRGMCVALPPVPRVPLLMPGSLMCSC
jgi:hypothetical protein